VQKQVKESSILVALVRMHTPPQHVNARTVGMAVRALSLYNQSPEGGTHTHTGSRCCLYSSVPSLLRIETASLCDVFVRLDRAMAKQ